MLIELAPPSIAVISIISRALFGRLIMIAGRNRSSSRAIDARGTVIGSIKIEGIDCKISQRGPKYQFYGWIVGTVVIK